MICDNKVNKIQPTLNKIPGSIPDRTVYTELVAFLTHKTITIHLTRYYS